MPSMDIGPITYAGNLPWLRQATILLTYHGSHAYGTATPTSDVDFKGVAVAPKSYYLGLDRFEQAEFKDPARNAEAVIYEIRKFVNLAAACNPNIIEVLWTEPEQHVICTPAGRELVDHRDLFLSKKARYTFSGYARAQLKRIKTHYRWIRYGADMSPPTREQFDLPNHTLIPADQLQAAEAEVQKRLDQWNLKGMDGLDPADRIEVLSGWSQILTEMKLGSKDALWRAAAQFSGHDTNFIQLMDRERRYKAAQNEWESYRRWKKERNPARAELEEKYGYDTKHAMHLVRLMRMCSEILEEGVVRVKRPDREELLAIRNGAWSYDKLVEYAEIEDKRMEEHYERSNLPKTPDLHKINDLCVRIVEEHMTR